MPLRGSPNGATHTRPQPGRDRSEQVVAINRNRWSQSAGMRSALYQRGLGVPQDLAEAMRWYQKAATPKAPKPGDSDQKESTSNPPEEKTSEFYWKEYERLMKFVQSTSGLITESGSDDYRRLADTAKQRAQFLDELESKRLTDIGRYQGYPSTTDSFVFWVLDTRTGEVRRCSTGGCFSQERP